MRKPGGRLVTLQANADAPAGGCGVTSLRSHWNPSVEISGRNAESGMREVSVRLANTICSIT